MAKRQAKHKSGKGPTSRPGRLRIVAGKWRSRVLDIADVEGLRPTSERIRETLFNWLTPEIAGKRCLDLFAGTGALGFEALSRGAREAVLVERSRQAADALRRNVALLGADGAQVIHGDAHQYLDRAEAGSMDIVFLDPPFADDALSELCRLIDNKNLLADGGVIYLEQDRDQAEPELPGGWTVSRQKTAGNVRYMLVRIEE